MIVIRTSHAPPMPAPPNDQDWNRQATAWEATLRGMAASAPRGPAAGRRRVALALTGKYARCDYLLLARSGAPLIGTEHEDLSCGQCGAILCAGLTSRALRRSHPEGRRLILRCDCRALNVAA